MLITIANFFEAPRYTAVAAVDMPIGSVCKPGQDASGKRTLTPVTADADMATPGKVGIAIKVSQDPLQVDSTTVPIEYLGSRLVTIKAGDNIVECRRNSIVGYDPSICDASLDPARGGALPTAGTKLGVKGGLPCATGAASALIVNDVLICHSILGGKILVELVK